MFFNRRRAARIGKGKAVTATARKTVAMFSNLLRYDENYCDPGGIITKSDINKGL